MSHVAIIEIEITDLAALTAACKRLGFSFQENQKTYEWYGRWEGDYPLPEGFSQEDLGKCDHAIRVPGAGYEVGVVKARKKSGYQLLWDFWSQGGLSEELGPKAEKLVQAYGVEKAKREARKQGFSVYETTREDGTVRLTLTRR
ncbi:MAG: DUF1257 domain-containing protein [bacterium]